LIIDIENSSNNIFRGLAVEAFLIKPVQRLPKYVLLLKDLLKHTDPDDDDYARIELALKQFKDVNSSINEKMNK
jgi:hypothetical protein